MPNNRLRPIAQVVCLGLAASGVLAMWSVGNQDFGQMALISLVVSVSCVLLVAQRWGREITKGPLLYLVLYLLFHLGLVWTLGISGEKAVIAVSPTAYAWVNTQYFQPAVALAVLGAVVFAAVSMVQRPEATAHATAFALSEEQQGAASRLAVFGIGLQIVGLVTLGITILQSGGFGLLLGGYLTFLEEAQTNGIAYAVWAIGIGSCLSQLGARAQRRTGLAIFGTYAITLFPLGLRGSVLFPAVVLLATRSLTGRRAPSLVLAGGALAALALSAVVRSTRIGGPAQPGGSWYSGALSSITELGFSLRPTTEVLRWEDSGQEHTHFVSFFAVPIRLLEKYTGWHGGPPAVDERLFNVKINALAGPIGGSPVAEAYDAGGIIGVVLVMAVLAFVISRISRHAPRRAVECALFPVVFLPLVIAVRNSFAPVLPQIAIGILTTLIIARTRPHDRGTTPGNRVAKVGQRSAR